MVAPKYYDNDNDDNDDDDDDNDNDNDDDDEDDTVHYNADAQQTCVLYDPQWLHAGSLALFWRLLI